MCGGDPRSFGAGARSRAAGAGDRDKGDGECRRGPHDGPAARGAECRAATRKAEGERCPGLSELRTGAADWGCGLRLRRLHFSVWARSSREDRRMVLSILSEASFHRSLHLPDGGEGATDPSPSPQPRQSGPARSGWAPEPRLPPGLLGTPGEEAEPLPRSRSGDSYRLLHRELAATVVNITNGCGR